MVYKTSHVLRSLKFAQAEARNDNLLRETETLVLKKTEYIWNKEDHILFLSHRNSGHLFALALSENAFIKTCCLVQ